MAGLGRLQLDPVVLLVTPSQIHPVVAPSQIHPALARPSWQWPDPVVKKPLGREANFTHVSFSSKLFDDEYNNTFYIFTWKEMTSPTKNHIQSNRTLCEQAY